MKKLLAALMVLGTLVSSALAKQGEITVGDDYGGSVYTYSMWYNRVRESGVPVRIEGLCISACTLVLSLPPEQVCIDRTASFGFHLTSIGGKTDPEMTKALIRRFYPKPVQAWLAARRLEEDVIFLSGDAVVAMGVFKSCPQGAQ